MGILSKLTEVFTGLGKPQKSHREVFFETMLGDETGFRDYVDGIRTPSQAMMTVARIDGTIKGITRTRQSFGEVMDRMADSTKEAAVTVYRSQQRFGQVPEQYKQNLADFAFDQLDKLSSAKSNHAEEATAQLALLQARKAFIETTFGLKPSSPAGMSDRAPR